MLPDELFTPLIDFPRHETDRRGCLEVGYEGETTKSNLDFFIKKVKFFLFYNIFIMFSKVQKNGWKYSYSLACQI